MRLWRRLSAEERFWRWFQDHSEKLFAFERDQERIFDQLGRELRRVESGLTFEFSAIQDGKREFVVSADGVRALFPAVRRLVAAAPDLPQWTVVPFRAPGDITFVVEYAGTRLGPDDLWFSSHPDGEKTGLVIYVRGLTEANNDVLRGAGYILLDNALGEYAVETQVSFIDWRALPQDPEHSGLRPFEVVREVFDTVAH